MPERLLIVSELMETFQGRSFGSLVRKGKFWLAKPVSDEYIGLSKNRSDMKKALCFGGSTTEKLNKMSINRASP